MAVLVFGFGSGGGEDVEKDRNNVPEEHSGPAEGNHRLKRGEPKPVTKGQSRRKAEKTEDKRY
jgi:hypothetical protein